MYLLKVIYVQAYFLAASISIQPIQSCLFNGLNFLNNMCIFAYYITAMIIIAEQNTVHLWFSKNHTIEIIYIYLFKNNVSVIMSFY